VQSTSSKMILSIFLALAVFGSIRGQLPTTERPHLDPHILHLHGSICHSNQQQWAEDLVINIIVSEIDANHDNHVSDMEIVDFFVSLIGIDLGPIVEILGVSSTEELVAAVGHVSVEKHLFVNAWHERYHDNLEFVGGTFDRFDVNMDGRMDVIEIENIINRAMDHGDCDNSGDLSKNEFVSFLEALYKHCEDGVQLESQISECSRYHPAQFSQTTIPPTTTTSGWTWGFD